MGGPRREITPEQQEYLSRLKINAKSRNGRYYRADFADMQDILTASGHDYPNDSDYQELRAKRKNDTEFKSSKSRIEQYFKYKTEKGRQINVSDTEIQDLTENTTPQDLAGANETANTELDEQGSDNTEQVISQEPESEAVININTVNTPESNSAELIPQNTKKAGRKKIYGDRVKLTLYISKELENAISCISKAKNISMSNYAVNILEQEISKKKAVLEQLLALQAEL